MSVKWKLLGTNASEFNQEPKEVRKKRFQKANKMNRNLEKMKLEDLVKEGLDANRDRLAAKASYEAAKAEGKLWSKAQKKESKEAKKAERKAARLAKKSA